jgi:two-component system, chemotaxis family, chemotaxis protein CheY
MPRIGAESREGESVTDILVIDDDDEIRRILRTILEGVGYEVYEAPNGPEGILCCQVQSIDVVIMDILMPEQDGLETMQALRANDPPPKIIAMSSGGQTGLFNFLPIGALFGADRTVQKPIQAHNLLTTVQALVAES